MGRRGPAPKSLAIRVLEGSRRDRWNLQQPVPEQVGPTTPDMFNADQRALWDSVVERLTDRGLAYAVDQERLAAYIFAEWLVGECARRVNATGLLVRGRNGEPVTNPMLRVQHRADGTATALAREFGLTPASRSRQAPQSCTA